MLNATGSLGTAVGNVVPGEMTASSEARWSTVAVGQDEHIGTTATADQPLGRYPWVALSVVLIGTYMVILDSTIVNVALPQIGIALHASQGIEWIVTAYLLAVGVAQPATGWLADRFGRKQIFVISLALFAVGSTLVAFSPNLPVLVFFRIVQGLGGGALMPVGMAIIYELFPPHKRGTALGVWGIAAMAAPAVGPPLGGYLVTAASWRWLFLINVPIGAIGVVAAIRLLRDVGFREQRRFDAGGFGLAATGLVALLVGFSQASGWGWASPASIAVLAFGVVALAAFVVQERRVDEPLIDLRMFGYRTFNLTMIIVWLITVMQFARLVFIPLELETVRNLTALKVGLLLTPAALGVAATMPIGGRLADHVGARFPVALGSSIIAGAAWMLAHLSKTTSLSTIVAILVVQGMGTGLAMMPNTVAAMNALPSRFVAQASAVRSLNRQVAGALGTAVLATVVASRIGAVSAAGGVAVDRAQGAYNTVFVFGFWAMVGAAGLSFFLPGRAENRRIQAERAAEHDEIVAGMADHA